MNYTLIADQLTFRTGANTEAARHAPSHAIGFAVDHLNEYLHTGWSVLVFGNARLLDMASLLALDIRKTLQPWPEGRRSLVLQLPLTNMTGRLVHPA